MVQNKDLKATRDTRACYLIFQFNMIQLSSTVPLVLELLFDCQKTATSLHIFKAVNSV